MSQKSDEERFIESEKYWRTIAMILGISVVLLLGIIFWLMVVYIGVFWFAFAGPHSSEQNNYFCPTNYTITYGNNLKTYLSTYVNDKLCKFDGITSEQWIGSYIYQLYIIHHNNETSVNFENAFHKILELDDLSKKHCNWIK